MKYTSMFKLNVVNVSSSCVPNQIKFNGNRTSDSREEDIFHKPIYFYYVAMHLTSILRKWSGPSNTWTAAIVLNLNGFHSYITFIL